jgi:hypothetical protein
MLQLPQGVGYRSGVQDTVSVGRWGGRDEVAGKEPVFDGVYALLYTIRCNLGLSKRVLVQHSCKAAAKKKKKGHPEVRPR